MWEFWIGENEMTGTLDAVSSFGLCSARSIIGLRLRKRALGINLSIANGS